MRRVYLLYWYWTIAGGLLGLGMLGLLTVGWTLLLPGLGMMAIGRLLRLNVR
jgi:hypothetical protein